MGNDRTQENSPNQLQEPLYSQFENIDIERNVEREDISKGTFKDQYNYEKKDPKDFYDYIININTFSQKPNIKWLIEKKAELKDIPMPENDNKIEENINDNNQKIEEINEKKELNEENINENIKDNIEIKKKDDDIDIDDNDKAVIGILGFGNVGKSYLLSLFTKQELPSGYSIHTKGISIKKIKDFIILDSEGIDAALTKKNISKELYPKENLLNKNINESDALIEMIARDKKAVELFIQDFIIEKSHILVIVVGQLTLREQKLINNVVKTAKENKSIYVIHNLKNFYSKEQISDYIENTFKKNIFFQQGQTLTEQIYKGKAFLKNKEDVFDGYFIETYNNSITVQHFIMGSNVKESQNYYYNKTVKDYFEEKFSSFIKKEFNVFKELKNFIADSGWKYIESSESYKNPFSKEDISIEKDGEIKYISIKNEKNRIKKCIMNQLGYSHFYGALYRPNYTCYVDNNKEKKEKRLIIDINAPGEGFEFNKKYRENDTNDSNKIILSFTGNKKLIEYDDSEILESKMDSGDFRIDICLERDKTYPKDGQIKIKNLVGIVRYIYPLVDDSNPEKEKKSIKVDYSQKEKEKAKDKKDKKENKDEIINEKE